MGEQLLEAKTYEPQGIEVPRYCEKDLLAIMGTADPTRNMAPFGDEAFEIWGCHVCCVYPDIKRLDVQFEMHGEGYWKRTEILERINKQTVPIYMQQVNPEVKNSIRFPVEIFDHYRKYSVSTISHMLALAYHSFIMTEKPKHVALFGVMMLADEEYSEQRPSCEYWLGRMEGAGMDIMINPGSAILSSPGLYGYHNFNPAVYDFQTRHLQLNNGLNASRIKIKKWETQAAKNEGAIAENEYWMQRFRKGEIG